jgi:hypothetical protein
MNPATILDRLHARALGRLTLAEQQELERELAADPALRALADDYALVFALTAADPARGDPRTRFEELEPRLEGARAAPLRRVAAAALVLGVAGAAFWAGRATRSTEHDGPLYLGAIELDPPLGILAEPADLPGAWSEYDPRGAQGVRFLQDVGEAEELAHAAGRPLLVYGSYPGCPMAAALDAKVFSDPAVIELAERTVPVRVNLADLPEAEQRSMTARGYPFLEMWRADGHTTHSLARNPDPSVFVESLHDGLARSDAEGEQRPWPELRAAAGRFAAARAAELDGRLAEAERGFQALVADAESPAPIAARAAVGLARLGESARSTLLEARASAASDVQAARALLEHARERFAGTRFENDLAAALERLRAEGRFPALAEADHSS